MGDMVAERARADQSWPGQTGGVARAIHTARHAANPAYAGCNPSATYPIAATDARVTYRHAQAGACAIEPLTVYEIMAVLGGTRPAGGYLMNTESGGAKQPGLDGRGMPQRELVFVMPLRGIGRTWSSPLPDQRPSRHAA
jgi:hypothetical protein